MRELAGTRANFQDRETTRGSEFTKELCEVTRKRCRKQRTRFRRRAIVACSSLPNSIGAIVTFALIVQRGFHPFVETDWAVAPDSFSQTFFEIQCFSESDFSSSLVV